MIRIETQMTASARQHPARQTTGSAMTMSVPCEEHTRWMEADALRMSARSSERIRRGGASSHSELARPPTDTRLPATAHSGRPI